MKAMAVREQSGPGPIRLTRRSIRAPEMHVVSVKPWTLHVRAAGRTWRLAGDSLGLESKLPDAQMLVLVARLLGLLPGSLDGYAVDRADDVVVVRPWAVWG
jgi:hypothetical protein